jgi:glycerophosphoryl diester phosphodiesterase
MSLPKIIGHRGARASVAENTLQSFEKAKQEGAKWVELDTMLSKDGVAMVFHDEELDRMTNLSGRLDEKFFNQLEKAIIDGDKKIPTLDEVLTLAKAQKLCVNVEIKPSCHKMAEQTAQEALKSVKKSGLSCDEVIFSSFDWDSLREIKKQTQDYRLGVLVDENSQDWEETAKELGAFSLHHDTDIISIDDVQKAKKLGLEILVYTVNDIKRAKELWDMGVTSIFTDCPAKILEKM